VDGLDEAKEVWTTLRMAHEGSKLMRKVKKICLRGTSIDSSCLMMKPLVARSCSKKGSEGGALGGGQPNSGAAY
jgi:hypothetical protein